MIASKNRFKVESDANLDSKGKLTERAIASILFQGVDECNKEKKKAENKGNDTLVWRKMDDCIVTLDKTVNATDKFFESLNKAVKDGKIKSIKNKISFKKLIADLQQEYFYQYDGSTTEPIEGS